MRREDEVVQSEMYKRFADINHKLELKKLQALITNEDFIGDDFKRAFILFTIGVILAPNTVDRLDWSYILVVEDVSLIPKFNWGQFTLAHLLNSCCSFNSKKGGGNSKKRGSLQGNLFLLQVGSSLFSSYSHHAYAKN